MVGGRGEREAVSRQANASGASWVGRVRGVGDTVLVLLLRKSVRSERGISVDCEVVAGALDEVFFFLRKLWKDIPQGVL